MTAGGRWLISCATIIRHESAAVQHLNLIRILSLVHMIKTDKRIIIVRGEIDVAAFFVVVGISVDIDIRRRSEVHVLHSSAFGRRNLPPVWCINGFSGRDVSFEYATQSPNFLRRREKKLSFESYPLFNMSNFEAW